jgi:hypothetical protein
MVTIISLPSMLRFGYIFTTFVALSRHASVPPWIQGSTCAKRPCLRLPCRLSCERQAGPTCKDYLQPPDLPSTLHLLALSCNARKELWGSGAGLPMTTGGAARPAPGELRPREVRTVATREVRAPGKLRP